MNGESLQQATATRSAADRRRSTRAIATEALEKGKDAYPEDSDITVYYDPDRPSSAVLAPGVNWGSFVPAILGLLFGPPSLLLLYQAWALNRAVTPS